LILYLGFLAWKKEVREIEIKEAKWLDVVLLLIGFAGIIIGAQLLISSSVDIAKALGISEWVIGVTIVAFGTSVPELAVSITAAIRKYYAISAGNLIGSNIFNIFGVIGFAGILTKMSFDPAARFDIGIMLGSGILVTTLMRRGWMVSRKEGLLLVFIGVAWWYKLLVLS
jgi:cation:H+ antiporter